MSDGGNLGIGVLLLSLVALGSWPALLDLAFLRGRHPSHAYLDYATAVLLVATSFALASGQPLSVSSESWASAGLAAVGGCLLMLGNLSMQRALLLGVPLTIVLPLQGSLTVVLGTSINYVLQPERSEPRRLFAGVAAFLVAIALSATAHVAHERQAANRRERRRRRKRQHAASCRPCCGAQAPLVNGAGSSTPQAGELTIESAPAADAATTTATANATTGLFVAAAGGLCFGFFSPCFNLAVNDELGWVRQSGGAPLKVFAANLYFCVAFALSAWAANLALMRWPPPGTQRSSLSEYASSPSDGRWLALLSGVVCAIGNAAQFVGGDMAGFASADLVQAFPIVGTVWGVACLGEFRKASSRVYVLLAAMYGAFLSAVALLAWSVR